ncbi:MAG: NAD kinase [Flavobacteriaceae bacterium]|nr:NAD kinase [Flavobacteriaceae bacterium]
MLDKILKFALFAKLDPNENNDHIFSVFKSLNKHQLDYDIDSQSFDLISRLHSRDESLNFSKFEKLTNQYDFVISIGGDGTILRSADEIGELSIPIIGLNKGRLGFLANSTVEIIDSIIEKITNSDYQISDRTIIQVEFEGKIKNALNEISISRKNTTSLITIDTKLNDQYLNTYWADGLIISTPTGSTGYSLSCGGPIIMPDSKNLVLTPIAPHNLNARPLVISDNKQIEISINGRESEYFVSADSKIFSVNINSKVVISKASYCLKMIEFDENSYLNTLRDKLMWGKDKRTEQ